ncbi:hypothetical protein C3369_15095 [Escherichia sp. ESNIH1]|uniref:hypothetical protein n=1 Tax=Escherichia sp. ESNIH1 TaxID=1985876 RepID=UPI000CDD30F7|nr:hypothetical protein [Escherichia sp. ESNIH1]POU00215.1 hypothetical protein C3369_15095 [Escherichia sp. ESNIH1]
MSVEPDVYIDIEKSKKNYDIYAVIGYAVSCLIALGKPVETENILAQLRQTEKKSVDGMKKLHAEAIRMVTNDKYKTS